MYKHILSNEEIEELICAKFGWYCKGCTYNLGNGDCRISRDNLILEVDEDGVINER